MDVLAVIEPEVVAVTVQAVDVVDVVRAEILAVDVQSIESLIGESVEIITETVRGAEAIEHMEAEVIIDQLTQVEIITVGIQGPPGAGGDDTPLAKRTDFISDALLYRGEAVIGAQDAQPLWRIRRISIVDGAQMTEEWAGGSADFNKAWADRAGLTYL